MLTRKPWQVMIDYHPEVGHLFCRVREHTHASVAFSERAVEYCGGAAETDPDGYVIRCHDEPIFADVAREIAALSALEGKADVLAAALPLIRDLLAANHRERAALRRLFQRAARARKGGDPAPTPPEF